MHFKLIIIILFLASCSGSNNRGPIVLDLPPKLEFENFEQKISYCIGLDHASGSYTVYQSKETKDKFDINQLQSGMIDYLSGNPLRVPFETKDSIFELYLLPNGEVNETAVSKIDASYAIGMDEAYMLIGGLVGRNIDQDIDVEYLLLGVNDALEQKEPSIPYVQARNEIAIYYADLNLKLGTQFLDENKEKEGRGAETPQDVLNYEQILESIQ